jgi:hypothetical protein
MSTTQATAAEPAAAQPGSALPSTWRNVSATLFALSRASLPAILAAALLARDPPLSGALLLELVVALALLPGLAAAAVQTAFAAQVQVRDGHLVTLTARRRVEIPVSALGDVVPWRVPLPRPGAWLHTRSGRRLSAGLALDDPEPTLLALADAGCEPARRALAHPHLVYAHARAAVRRRLWHHPLFKFGAFGLIPAAVLFRAHQYIAYGGLLGEWQLRGAAAWLQSAAGYAVVTVIYLVLYASVWRGVAEGAAWLAARLAPARAVAVRRIGEAACTAAYYLGIPALLAWRFLV